jgi:hypothetical protein
MGFFEIANRSGGAHAKNMVSRSVVTTNLGKVAQILGRGKGSGLMCMFKQIHC